MDAQSAKTTGRGGVRGFDGHKRRGRRHDFRVSGLTWIVERSFAWLGANRRLAKEYEFRQVFPRA